MVDQIFESAELSFYIGGSALLGEPRNGDCVRRGRPVAEYMYCDAEEAVEATKMPTEARVLWGPVTKQVADAIGVPTAVASVLLRPSSATAEATARMEAHRVLYPVSERRIVLHRCPVTVGAQSAGRERDWSYELTSATATGGLICQFVTCYELCAIATQRSGRRSKWLQPQKCSAFPRAAQSDQAWNESKRGEAGSEF